jgi:hypothetical protein
MTEATICDMKGNSISEGTYVKYLGTDTRGKVKEIRSADNKKWVLLDSTELLYDSNYVEVIREEEKATDREAQSLEEFKKRLEEKRATLQKEMANVDECGA